MDGKSMFELLDRPNGRIRELLPLIQVWPHTEACQALRVVTDDAGNRPKRQNKQKQAGSILKRGPDSDRLISASNSVLQVWLTPNI
jgi:hypothetical protein